LFADRYYSRLTAKGRSILAAPPERDANPRSPATWRQAGTA
jgi:hypothetical protein